MRLQLAIVRFSRSPDCSRAPLLPLLDPRLILAHPVCSFVLCAQASELPNGAIVIHNSEHGYDLQRRFRLLQTVKVQTSWDPAHKVGGASLDCPRTLFLPAALAPWGAAEL